MAVYDAFPVERFAAYESEADKLLAYPGSVPDSSFLIDGGRQVILLPDDSTEFIEVADKFLHAWGLPGIVDRIAVVDYGLNANPGAVREKMQKFGGEDLQDAMQTVPKIKAVVPDNQIVWHGEPGQKGSTFAELYKAEETTGLEAECFVSFVDEKQWAAINTTEGETYRIQYIDTLIGSDRRPTRALAYVSGSSSVILKDGQPIPVRRPGVDSEGWSAEQTVDYMLAHAGGAIGIDSARKLIERADGEKLSVRRKLQKAVGESLLSQGLQRELSYPDEAGDSLGRADFNGLKRPHYDVLRLMEEVVAPLRPYLFEIETLATTIQNKEKTDRPTAINKARAKLDIAHVLRGRARTELVIRLAANPPTVSIAKLAEKC